MPGTPSIMAAAKMAVDDSVATAVSSFDANSFRVAFENEDLRLAQSYGGGEEIRGTRSMHDGRVVLEREQVTGGFLTRPTPLELDHWLARILGTAESSDVFALAETLPKWSMLVDRVTQRHVYTGLQVSRAVFSGTQGGSVTLRIDAEGIEEILSADAFPGTVPAFAAGAPYIFGQTTFSLDADESADEVLAWELTIDNQLDTERYANSIHRENMAALGRLITLNMTLPYNATTIALYKQAVAGAAGSLTLTNGNVSCLFDFANLKVPAESPVTPQRIGEYTMQLNMTAYATDSDKELVVTSDSDAGS